MRGPSKLLSGGAKTLTTWCTLLNNRERYREWDSLARFVLLLHCKIRDCRYTHTYIYITDGWEEPREGKNRQLVVFRARSARSINSSSVVCFFVFVLMIVRLPYLRKFRTLRIVACTRSVHDTTIAPASKSNLYAIKPCNIYARTTLSCVIGKIKKIKNPNNFVRAKTACTCFSHTRYFIVGVTRVPFLSC